MARKKKKPTYEEALAILEQAPSPSQRFAKAIGHASGIDSREDVRAEVALQQEDYRERMRRALVAVAERRMEGLNDSIELIGEIERDLRESLRTHRKDLSPAEQSKIKKALEKSVDSQIELMKELAFKPEPGANVSIDARSYVVGHGLETIQPAFRERLRLLAEKIALASTTLEGTIGDTIDVESQSSSTSSDDRGKSQAD